MIETIILIMAIASVLLGYGLGLYFAISDQRAMFGAVISKVEIVKAVLTGGTALAVFILAISAIVLMVLTLVFGLIALTGVI